MLLVAWGHRPRGLRQEEDDAHLWQVQVVDVLPLLFGAVLRIRPSSGGRVFYITFCPFRNYHDACQERSH